MDVPPPLDSLHFLRPSLNSDIDGCLLVVTTHFINSLLQHNGSMFIGERVVTITVTEVAVGDCTRMARKAPLQASRRRARGGDVSGSARGCAGVECVDDCQSRLEAHLRVRELVYVALYLLVWGEAGNLRFTPECICYIYHFMAKELYHVIDEHIDPDTGRPFMPTVSGELWFLMSVILPIYNTIKVDSSKNGKAPHSAWRNYDDVNEYFWSRRCLKRLGWPLNLGCNFFGTTPKEKHVGKTDFVEQRSFWNVYKSFDRHSYLGCKTKRFNLVRFASTWVVVFSLVFVMGMQPLTPMRPRLGDLPESCVALLLMYLDPPDICMLARLNRVFRDASLADFIWESKFPVNYKFIVEKALKDVSVEDSGKRDIYATLCRPNCLTTGPRKFGWIRGRVGCVWRFLPKR
ncbi:unnamed protein product [Sphenostylis stenocarpa]|uniref:F-box domain-containing protein n=1 Tax=Sphenostylis stenocarpa TaxID=92480 RepID=A0AA86RU45_9FABA|nr:unnamed protein product [Sphenostylis stenocarpa]